MGDYSLCERCLDQNVDMGGVGVIAYDARGRIVEQSWCECCYTDYSMDCTVCGKPHEEQLMARTGVCMSCQTTADDLRYDAIGDQDYEDAVYAASEKRRHE